MEQVKKLKKKALPPSFRPLLWSYNTKRLNVDEHRRDIILNVIAYGDLKHWRELVYLYGREGIRRVLSGSLQTELRPSVRHLAEILFHIPHTHHVSQHSRR